MIHDAMQAMAARLRAAGVPAAIDERDLNPPAVLVQPPVLDYTYLDPTGAKATWSLLVAATNAGTGTALAVLSDLVEQTRAALDWEPTTAAPAYVTTSEGPPVPAYRLTFTTDIGG